MMIIPPLWGIWDLKKQQFARRFFFCYFFIMGAYKTYNAFTLVEKIQKYYITLLIYYLV